ncbi:nucleosidase [Enemella evansiae]|uniref:nucleosidase n=1 Tax=Enemella evansiae TaxID=2016499 RepID=UPI000B963386|nr:nucleosidase [Enemella evansiae]OYO18788.1 nucleosidase [Enemella evansiae]
MRPLVLVAHRWEAAHLPADVDLVITGVGMTPAAVAATREILQRCPDPQSRHELRAINLGSCGALTEGLSGIFEPSAVLNRDIDEEVLAAAGVRVENRIELTGDGPVLGTGDSFVAGGAAREALLGRCDLVDMEGFAIAYACRALGVPLRMIKHVSDSADQQALAWKDLVDRSARALAEAYARIAD